jgi:glucokinase
MILVGDIGGTNTRLALFEAFHNSDALRHRDIDIFPSAQYGGLDEIAAIFLRQTGASVEVACFGIAGPVRDGVSKVSNLPWVVDARQISVKLAIERVSLLNDLEANAHGIAVLEPSDFVTLNEGTAASTGNCALISAGTGLGEAGLLAEGNGYRPFASEGGHGDFAPRNELEIELLRYLLKRWSHVSCERVLSGPGLFTIYQFLRDTGRGSEPAWLAERMDVENPSAVISETALAGAAEICVQALDMFVAIYGAEAGNLALKLMATGGVFIGGGIAPKIVAKLEDSTFMTAFVDKGRFRSLLESIPVRVIMNDKTALLGAAHYAAQAKTATP